MVAELIAGLGAFKAMFDIAKSMKDMNDAVSRNAAVYELSEQILATQARYAAAIQEIDALKKERASKETWESEKQRYELKQLFRGPFAYILKEGKEDGEDPHALCTNCYQRGFKAILQSNGEVIVHNHSWDCPACKTKAKCQWRDMAALIKKTREDSATPSA